MARPRKPIDHLKLHGTYDKSRHGKRDATEPRPGGEPVIPDYLSGDAAIHWMEVVPGLVRAKIVTVADQQALVEMCQWWGELRRLWAIENMDYKTFQMANMASKRWHEYAKNFGMTPSARASLTIVDSKPRSSASEFLA